MSERIPSNAVEEQLSEIQVRLTAIEAKLGCLACMEHGKRLTALEKESAKQQGWISGALFMAHAIADENQAIPHIQGNP